MPEMVYCAGWQYVLRHSASLQAFRSSMHNGRLQLRMRAQHHVARSEMKTVVLHGMTACFPDTKRLSLVGRYAEASVKFDYIRGVD